MEQVVSLASPVCSMVVNGVAFHPGLGQESCDAIGTMERPGEEKQNATRTRSGANHVVSRAHVMGGRGLLRCLS
eukprot:6002799-Pleurochrysis_carterae.AAC.1